MNLSRKTKMLLGFFKYFSIIICCALFFYMMKDVWDKFNNQMTSMGVRFRGENIKEKHLPCVTACPWSAFRERGFYFKKDEFSKQTYKKDDIFFNASIAALYNLSLFSVEEINSIFLGRCYMACHLNPVPKKIPSNIFFWKQRDITSRSKNVSLKDKF